MKTRYSPRVWAGFELVFRPWMKRRLGGIHLRGIDQVAWIPNDIPILMVSNHTSWWDGFLLREVHRRLRPDAPLHVIMLEEHIRNNAVFRWMGAVPLGDSRLAARGLLRDLRDRTEQRHDAVLGFFPQGRIWPSYRRPLGFESGAGWLASRLSPIAVVPVGLHLEPLTEPGPAAFISVGQPTIVRSGIRATALEAMVTAELDTILACTRGHGEDAPAVWERPRERAG